MRDCARRTIRLVANEPEARDEAEYEEKIAQLVNDHDLPDAGDIIFVEVTVSDYSDFESDIDVRGGSLHGRYRVLTVEASSIPNALAALVLDIRDHTGVRPHIYFEWPERNPLMHVLWFLLFGVGDVAPVTREVIRRAEADRASRPAVPNVRGQNN